jgi:hypothetical protein
MLRYWQAICSQAFIKLGLILEHIINFIEVKRILMYMQFDFCCDTAIITHLPRRLTAIC